MRPSAWDKRIERAGELAQTCSSAAEPLRFYAAIAGFQKNLYEQLRPASQREDLLRYFRPLLSLVKQVGPPPLAHRADELARDTRGCENLLAGYKELEDEGQVFFARALLQPYAEYLAGRSNIPLGAVRPACPFCGERPQVGVLRGEGDGAKRSFICSLCSTEWDYRRILCPNCGEEQEDKLPVYTASDFAHVRVEACESCRIYIKSVDLSSNGLAVPVVDELATIPLSLWAEEKGYAKLQPNLLGM